ncbi:Gfo/Idh/MocA family protein [Streptomyces sp. NBC_00893]|uniref:Gfo/Idh/MocA family protein n=1 Tax=Streptomyces sp. NBC_00893 TaxID=2975862 RepID=UPI00224D7F2A|nr:Gfo/Idh/MocA family oxidoreductase [Streptomyces sp. NBC_00893]MCX4850589.1 Gfo/Idh/MocA family oxidoreductase [Streptomyces sp. NBC_00893]
MKPANNHPISVAIVGAGTRGLGYARRATAQGARITAVADPHSEPRASFAAEFDLAPNRVFDDAAVLLGGERLADAVVISSPDTCHADQAVLAAQQGYAMLLEKPMALDEDDCVRIIEAVERAGVVFTVGHVLRYTPYTQVLKELLSSGRIGTIVSIEHLEPVGWWHQAHSYVRGNWRREDESGPMLLTKSCHDLDWLMYVMDEEPDKVSSFGSLSHFTAAHKPLSATDTCVTCPAEQSCAYSAKKIYMSCLGDPAREYWPLSMVTRDTTPQGVLAALEHSPYGRCVYSCDNDVVDHQVVGLEFPSGATASFTMTAFTPLVHRKTRIFGTRGCLEGDGEVVRLHDFAADRTEEHRITDTHPGASAADGHAGGDDALIAAFLDAVATGDTSALPSDARTSLAGHRVVWAAEKARLSRTVVVLDAPDTANAPVA